MIARRHLAVAAAVLWLAVFALSFGIMLVTEPTGDGLTRGLNRIGVFLGWQAAAVVVALGALALGAGRLEARPAVRWLSRAPAIVQGSLVLLVVVLVLSVRFAGPSRAPGAPAQPATTAPAHSAEPITPEPELVEVESVAPATQQFSGIYRSGFEASHFYTMDGRGPWWLEADTDDSERLAAFDVDGPGRAGGVRAALIVEGWLDEPGDALDHIGAFEYRLNVVSIESVRGLSETDFDLVLDSVTAR